MSFFKKYLFWTGAALIIIGFVIDVLFAGIPYQDAPIQLQESYRYNETISEVFIVVGFAFIVIGMLLRTYKKFLGK